MGEYLEGHLELTTDIVSAYVGNNPVPIAELPKLIVSVSAALSALTQPAPKPKEELVPAVNPKRSVFPDYIVSLENGEKFKSLRAHLTRRGMTPEQYREKWGLPRDYPMVTSNYAAARSKLAKRMGLGRKAIKPSPEATRASSDIAATKATAVAQSAKRRGRKPNADA